MKSGYKILLTDLVLAELEKTIEYKKPNPRVDSHFTD